MTRGALSLAQQCQAAGLPVPEREVQFHPSRKWRADYLWRAQNVLCEVDGGTFVAGRHSRGTGYERDAEKLNTAVVMGYRVIRVTPKMVNDGRALSYLERLLK